MTLSSHEVLAAIGGIKTVFKVVSALVTLVVGKFSFKFDQDLPAPLLIVFAIAAVYFLSLIEDSEVRNSAMIWLVSGLVVSSIIFLLVYRYFSYEKKVDNQPPRWKFWRPRYATVRIVGGYWLRRDAKEAIERANITIADYFSGVGFNEDKVWWRWSCALAWLTLVVAYFVMILCAVGTLYLASVGWM
jgi:hypothetical protein